MIRWSELSQQQKTKEADAVLVNIDAAGGWTDPAPYRAQSEDALGRNAHRVATDRGHLDEDGRLTNDGRARVVEVLAEREAEDS